MKLTKTEKELVREILKGKQNKEIATALGLTVGTVKVYLTKVYRKAGVEGRLQLALKMKGKEVA